MTTYTVKSLSNPFRIHPNHTTFATFLAGFSDAPSTSLAVKRSMVCC
nr:MAG TPA: hypothetical protein [Caudoviricetes sp.]